MSENDTRYRFISTAAPTDEPLQVVRFEGTESVFTPFEFNIELKSRSSKIDIDALLRQSCALEMTVGGKTRTVNGILAQFDVVGRVSEFIIYRAVLVARLWQLSLYQTNEVYIEMSVPDIIEQVLEEAGLTALDYEFRLTRDYKVWPFRCQFNETFLQFIHRLMEHEGIYYFFDHVDDIDKLIICDHIYGQDTLTDNKIRYAPPTGLDVGTLPVATHSFVCRQKRLPKRLVLKDYNDENPSVNIVGEAVIDPDGIGEVYDYGTNLESPNEGKTLAQIRAEEIAGGKRRYHGESTIVTLEAGYIVALEEHFHAAMNQSYQVLSIHHEGHQPSLLTGEATDAAGYQNTFTAIPADVQFRPERNTPRPRFYGTMEAFIDAEGDGEYAEIDSTGRYKVVLPFDRVKRQEAKASCWVRMAQPYSGVTEGMHFPLRKGTEVLLTFIGGDPDRPVISGAVPNHAQPSVVTDSNQSSSVIQTSKGNRIEIEDREDRNRIKFQTGDNKTYMHMGAPNHDGDGWVVITTGMERKEIQGGQQITIDTIATNSPDTETGDKSTIEGATGSAAVPASVPNNTNAVAIVGVTTGTGKWQYSADGSTWVDFPSDIASSKALLLNSQYQIRYQPATGGESGTVALSYRSFDRHMTGDQVDATDNPTIDSSNVSEDLDLNVADAEVTSTQVASGSCIAVVSAPVPTGVEGTWQYSTDGGSNWTDLPDDLSTTNAFLMDDSYSLQFKKDSASAVNANATLTYRSWITNPNNCRVDVSDSSYSDFFSTSDSSEELDLVDVIDEHELFEFRKQETDGVATSSDLDRTQNGDSLTREEELTGDYLIHRKRGPLYDWHEGPQFNYTVGTCINITYADNTAGSNGYQNNSQSYAELETDLINDLYGSSAGYSPTGAQVFETTTGKTWSNVIKDARVSLARCDTITGQKGNIYDFGGYWNYNLGNSYEENYLIQNPALNGSYDMDILNAGGPVYTGFKSSLTVASGVTESLSSHDVNYVIGDVDVANRNLCTTKNFEVDSYEFSKGCIGIEISDGCHSLEISKGGKSVELNFNGDGKKTSWSKSGEGHSREKAWYPGTGNKVAESHSWVTSDGKKWEDYSYDPETEAITSYETGHKGHGVHVFEANFGAKASASFDFSASTSFSFSASTSFSLSISLSVFASITVDVAGKLTIDVTGGVHFKMESDNVKVRVRHNGAWVDAGPLKVAQELVKLEQMTTHMHSRVIDVKKIEADIKAGMAEVDTSAIKIFS